MWISNIQKTNPKLHKEAANEDKQFQCLECEYQSRNKSDFVRHQNTVHYEGKF